MDSYVCGRLLFQNKSRAEALEARHIDASNGKFTAEVNGEVEEEEGVLVIRRIHVDMRLVAPAESPKELLLSIPGEACASCARLSQCLG